MPLTGDKGAFLSWGVLIAIGLLVQSIAPSTIRVYVGLSFWWILIGIGLTLTGVRERMKLMKFYGILVTVAGLTFEAGTAASVLPYSVTVLGFGAFVGVGLALVGWAADKAIFPVGLYMLLGSVLQYLAPPSLDAFMNFVWLILGGAAFVSFGFIKRTAFAHFTGVAFILGLVTVYVLGGSIVVAGLVGFVIVAAGLVASFLYMSQVLGRTPHVDEILTLAARALLTYGLRKPLDQYRAIAITIQGNIATELVINELLTRIEDKWFPILLLGPTSPTQITRSRRMQIGWVTSLPGTTGSDYTLLPPANPSDINIFYSTKVKEVAGGQLPILIGDFLDSMIPFMKEDAFYKYYSELASRLKLSNSTGVFVVKSDIHPEVAVNVVKSFADVVIENRERQQGTKIFREVRVSNKVDNLQTDWQAVPRSSYVG